MPTDTTFANGWIVTVNSKGRFTLPAEVRKHLQINDIHMLAVMIEPNGTITLKQPMYPTLESLAGAVPALNPPKAWDEVKAIVADDRAEAYLKKYPADN